MLLLMWGGAVGALYAEPTGGPTDGSSRFEASRTWERCAREAPDTRRCDARVPGRLRRAWDAGRVSAPRPSDESSPTRRAPAAIHLTWQRDPTRTMTIDWHTEDDRWDVPRPTRVLFRTAGGTPARWHAVRGDTRRVPELRRTLHRVELTKLDPGRTYRFRLSGFSRSYRFRTLPATVRDPVRFAVGGDVMGRRAWMEPTGRAVMRYDPDFVVMGGDLAYGDGRLDRVHRWVGWFEALRNSLVGEDGRVVPIVTGIGNHEAHDGLYYRAGDYEPGARWRARQAPYFYRFFAFPGQPGYGVLDAADYLSLVVLDSNHTNPVPGAQTRWLKSVLQARARVPHVFPVYHVPAFPSVRDYREGFYGRTSREIRRHWVPLFERYGVGVAFEHHDHAYKRTPPIRREEIDPRGVTYLGDGAWGVRSRGVHFPWWTWWLRRAESTRHAILVELEGAEQRFVAVRPDGTILDRHVRRTDSGTAGR